MRQSAETGESGKIGVRPVADEEQEAIRKMRVALRNPHGTSAENRDRVFSAWHKLRSVATSPDVQIKSQKRQRKTNRLKEKAKKKKANCRDKNIEQHNAKGVFAAPMREEDKMLHEAARLGQADRVRDLISLGSKVSSKDNSGYSALHWASLYGHVEVVRVLLRSGAGDGKRINRQNDAGNTALHLACIGHHAEVAAMLQIYKPDEYLMNAYDQSPVSLGLRELIEYVEKNQQLDDLQAVRASSNQRLLSESLDWRMERDSECAAGTTTDMTRETHIGNEVLTSLGGWEDYDTAWIKFADRFAATSNTADGAGRSANFLTTVKAEALPHDAIHFQDIPWPVTGIHMFTRSHMHGDGTQGNERLLLTDLGVKGAALRPLIQRERLRWHPDKFIQLFGRHLALEERSTILAGVQTVCQLLNFLADQTEEVGE